MRRIIILLACAAFSQPASLKFEDYTVTEPWSGKNAQVQLRTASERLFKTQLTDAAKEKPDFAGHFRFASWGCGSNCIAGAIINLHTGEVFAPPGKIGSETGWDRWIFALGIVEGSNVDYRLDSNLVIVRQQRQGVHAYIWEKNHFRPIPLPLAQQSVKR